MPNNPLTGDFAAVLQISASTINRLLASMHQNPGPPGPGSLPTLPHDSFIRIGDDTPVDGVRGTARAQVSVPAVELIHRSQDRTAFRIWLRIWYTPDSGSSPLREFSYGEMRVEYGLQTRQLPQSPEHPRGGVYAFLGFIPGSVSFESYGPDRSADAEIGRQIEAVLSRRYIPTPHPMLDEFQHRRFLSLVSVGEQAVAHALEVGAAGSAGDIASVRQIFLGGHHFAVAISRDYIMSLFSGPLNAIRALSLTFSVTIALGVKPFQVTSTAHYNVTISSATADWAAGTIQLNITGRAQGDGTDWAPDHADFSISQALALSFNPSTQSLALTQVGSPAVSVSVSGIYGSLVEGEAKKNVANIFNAQLSSALAAVQPQLQKATDEKQKLISQLQTFDTTANAAWVAAEFTVDGMILRGSVHLSPRTPVQLAFQKLDNEHGYTAQATWAPGGRVIEFRWKWEFDIAPSPPPGTEVDIETFLLLSRNGLPALPPPVSSHLPTVSGTVCLAIKAAQVNAVTGGEDLVDSQVVLGHLWCQHFWP
jgi:hypothetical protein